MVSVAVKNLGLALVLSAGSINIASAQASCVESDHQLFDKLLGTWEEYRIEDSADDVAEESSDDQPGTLPGTLIGTLTTNLVAQGCALRQSFVSPDQSFSFESLAYLDDTGIWQETYAMSNGTVSQYRWIENEEELILEQIGVRGSNRKRLVIYDIGENEYFVIDERSSDRGQSWEQFELVKTIRKLPQAQAE